MTTSVSILVAVYNAAPYLGQCLDSLLAQSIENIQILCMDDCSTDNSWEILQDYARRDARVEIFQMPENSGQAKARNELIRHARGKFVTFLDSDDWMASDTLENCVKVFDEHDDADCVLLRVLKIDENGTETDYDKPIPPSLTGFEAFKASLTWDIHGCYAARRDFFEQWPYDDTCRSYSDDNSTRQHYYHSRRVYYAPEARYFYRQNADSTTHRISVRRYDFLRANTSMKRQLIELNVGEEILDIYENI
ncbi:MAG: glycosyltransferase family 2 protein, partial [Prevotella sp.]|nr:glycosyltransferase family 2 protein [Prevotella sp.]